MGIHDSCTIITKIYLWGPIEIENKEWDQGEWKYKFGWVMREEKSQIRLREKNEELVKSGEKNIGVKKIE